MSKNKTEKDYKTELYSLKEVKPLNPYKEDEFYIIRKQTDLMRAKGKTLDFSDDRLYKLGDTVLIIGAMITLLMFSGFESFIVAGALFLITLLSNLLPSRSKNRKFKRLKRFLLAKAAVGDVVHGPYTVTLKGTAEKELRFQGMTSAQQTARPKISDFSWDQIKGMTQEELKSHNITPDDETEKLDDYLIMVVRDYDETDYSQVVNISDL